MIKSRSNVDMINSAPMKALLIFVVPMILGNLFQQFYNMADSAIAGRFIGPEALSAIGASYSIVMVFIASATGGSMGCAVIISQYFGAGEKEKMKTCICTALISIFAISIVLAITGAVFAGDILRFIRTPNDVFESGLCYLSIYFYGLPFLFMYNAFSAVFNSLSDSRTPLKLLIFSSLLNIFLDLYFIIKLNMGIAGAAWATLIAQGISALISAVILYFKISKIKCGRFRYFDIKMLLVMAKVAIPSILQQSIIYIGTLMVQSVINSFGTVILAGYTAGSKIHSVLIVPILAVGNACSTYTAQNMGAGKPERIKSGFISACKIIITLYSAVLIAVYLFAQSALHIFLKEPIDPVTLQTGISYLRFLAPFYFVFGFKAITDGILKGSGDVTVFTLANLINLSIRVSSAFIFSPVIGAKAVWFAIPAGWSANFIIEGLRYRSGKWKNKKLLK